MDAGIRLRRPKGAAFGGLTIDNRVRFFQIAIDNGPKLNMELEQQTYLGAPGGRLPSSS